MRAGAPHSARGVSGERKTRFDDAVRQYGSHIPNYRIAGEQHYRNPYKDKAHVIDSEPCREWKHEPAHRTRTELKAARRAAAVPDLSYDVDGDGGVGPTDYFICKQFSKERDMRLNTGERRQVVDALEGGMLDKYHFGYEQSGALRKNVVKQIRGKIFTGDNHDELNEVYPDHWNKHKDPYIKTQTELKLARKGLAINDANALKEAFDAKNPTKIPEPQPAQENMVEKPEFNHIRQRGEKWKQEARYNAGLDPGYTHENPMRTSMNPGLGYVENPQFTTRTEMNDHRRQKNVEDLTKTRRETEPHVVTQAVRHCIVEHGNFEMRRGDPDAMTATKLKDNRKKALIEHNMNNFELHTYREPARFEDQEKPWYSLRPHHYVDNPEMSLLKKKRDGPAEVTEKVNRNPHIKVEAPKTVMEDDDGELLGAGLMPREAACTEYEKQLQARFGAAELGQMAKKKWTGGFKPAGIANRAPRYMDKVDNHAAGIKQAATYSVDEAPLESFSSFSVIRESVSRHDKSLHGQSSEQSSGGAPGSNVNSRTLKSLGTRALAQGEEPQVNSPTSILGGGHLPTHKNAMLSEGGNRSILSAATPQTYSPSAASASRQRQYSANHRAGMATIQATPREDLSMTARLGRMATTAPPNDNWREPPKKRNSNSQPPSRQFAAAAELDMTNKPDVTSRASSRPPASSSATPTAMAAAPAPKPDAIAVRTSGFQWLESQNKINTGFSSARGGGRSTAATSMESRGGTFDRGISRGSGGAMSARSARS
eukprot:TRINITY_DN24279_c1_g2_i1.p1 TRINITY_DN24279_c1_g2~~TRINITY_DN24279_c1_g2_i1.p1  ORF type:complete len:768 (-),score=110.10 TRINITY_DN24279_c1_g2_i1:131-2434(-)